MWRKWFTLSLRWALTALQRVCYVISFRQWPSSVAVCVIVLDDDNRLLLVKRADGKGYGIPGGFVRLFEPIEETARREVMEETGLPLVIDGFAGFLSGRRQGGFACVDIIYYGHIDTKASDQRPHTSSEGRALWKPYEDARVDLAFDYDEVVGPFMRGRRPAPLDRDRSLISAGREKNRTLE
ncbi:MAG: NUDIX domain-containing protein [Phycisphaerales bacterium]